MLRTPQGWRIERIIQNRSWEYGNTAAVDEAIARSQAQAPAARAASRTGGLRAGQVVDAQ
jgi:hypothetical protein